MISGFTIIRNGDKLGYPYLEAIRSLAPLVDEIVVALGDSEDQTSESIRRLCSELSCPVVIVDSPWDPTSLKGGLELSRQTNIALEHCSHDVCFYIQADEGLDENEYEIIRSDLKRFSNDTTVDALSFHWRHFYGNFTHTIANRKWYRKEARVIKKSSGLRSYGDAQGFRIPKNNGKWHKGRAALSRAHVNHYGWVRPIEKMVEKTNSFNRLWHGETATKLSELDTLYVKQFGVRPFQGKLPKYIEDRAEALKGYDPFKHQKISNWAQYLSLLLADLVEQATGWRIGEYSSYKYVKKY
jgi:glycosyltransferase involved in cell wall biosynthesis